VISGRGSNMRALIEHAGLPGPPTGRPRAVRQGRRSRPRSGSEFAVTPRAAGAPLRGPPGVLTPAVAGDRRLRAVAIALAGFMPSSRPNSRRTHHEQHTRRTPATRRALRARCEHGARAFRDRGARRGPAIVQGQGAEFTRMTMRTRSRRGCSRWNTRSIPWPPVGTARATAIARRRAWLDGAD